MLYRCFIGTRVAVVMMLPVMWLGVLEGSAAPSPGKSATSVASGAPVNFVRDIQPLFARSCYKCHGRDRRKGGLRLDLRDEAMAGSDSGKVILPGKAVDSVLFKNVSGLNPDMVMPPKDGGDRLNEKELALLRRWMDQGARWPKEADANVYNADGERHWAFIAPQRPNPPIVQDEGWIRNPIDAFVLERLSQEHLKPSPEASRATLIRRLSLDLLGLPPSLDEVEAFVSDARHDAYEQLVQRLLSSPHFGERWGRHWLDLARYADSDGYEKDRRRPFAYVYRDWVIDAINEDLPFDQFSIEQIAGDLLPGATLQQRTATGFQRQTLTNTEGGTDQEEFRCKAVVDRVSTLGTVWLGLTVGCAECHSHKFDPIAQREFYQLFAFFNDASESNVPAPDPAALARYEAAFKPWEEKRAQLKQTADAYAANQLPARRARWASSFKPVPIQWSVLSVLEATSTSNAVLTTQKDKSIVVSGPVADTEVWTIEVETELSKITGFRLEILPDQEKVKDGEKGESTVSEFVVKVRLEPFAGASSGSAAAPAAEGADVSEDETSAGTAVSLHSATAVYNRKEKPVAAAIDGKSDTGWVVKPEFARNHEAVFKTKDDLLLGAGNRLIVQLEQRHGKPRGMRRFRLSATSTARPLKVEPTPQSIRDILARDKDQRDQGGGEERKALEKYYLEYVEQHYGKLKAELAAHEKKKPGYPSTKAAVLAKHSKPRSTHVHVRGDFLRKGDEVQPDAIAVLHPFESAAHRRPNRLDLARWLMNPANPLTSRVTVNRMWRNLFGHALVRSEADFGTRGEKPSHPELLDWLATEYPRLGWSRKEMIRVIVLSSTYRQSSAIRPELVQRDPLNHLLARQNRFRLEAEVVRDSYLMASGLLSPELRGPSIFPPLPADIAALGYANSIKWRNSKGSDRYRRGLYIFFQRTVPYPMLMTFDAPESNETCARRERSNTPLQALTLLNDPVFFECAQALGSQLAEAPGLGDHGPSQAIERGFERCLARKPTALERSRLEQFYQDHLRLLNENPGSANKIIGESESDPGSETESESETKPDSENAAKTATLIAVARTILNLDEFVTRE